MTPPRVLVFTYKEGLLSRFAHDLQIHCERFDITLAGERLRASFALASLRVDGAMTHGQLAAGVLSTGDRSKIEHTMAQDVLEVGRFGEAVFEGTATPSSTGATIAGTLTLHGRAVALAPFRGERRGALLVAELQLVPSRWGIAPYRALGGALKLQDRVTVRVELPATEPTAAEQRWTAG